jgi:hypothetical protein
VKKKADGKTRPINWTEPAEKYVVAPRPDRGRMVKKLKPLKSKKGTATSAAAYQPP